MAGFAPSVCYRSGDLNKENFLRLCGSLHIPYLEYVNFLPEDDRETLMNQGGGAVDFELRDKILLAGAGIDFRTLAKNGELENSKGLHLKAEGMLGVQITDAVALKAIFGYEKYSELGSDENDMNAITGKLVVEGKFNVKSGD